MKNKPELPGMPHQLKANIDPKALSDIVCKNTGCGNYTFTEVVLLKRVPAFMTETGKEGMIPIPTFACNVCGFVNEDFLPSFMRKSVSPPENKPSIDIVR